MEFALLKPKGLLICLKLSIYISIRKNGVLVLRSVRVYKHMKTINKWHIH